MHYLITGHTGFKGAWLSLLLASQGGQVSGLSLDPVTGSLYEKAALGGVLTHDLRVDIRDRDATVAAMRLVAPDVVFHLAAQPLVRESYREPRVTFETNAMGTLNVLEAVSLVSSVQASVVVTTDKVYRNVNQVGGYVESDPLGGDDPYSSSKAMADILTQSWVRSFPGVPTAVARAGNVVGGGDVSHDRLLPDLLDSFASGTPARLRYPEAVRPWQHVLDCLNGYVVLANALLSGKGQGEWNFGPGPESFVQVGELATMVARCWGDGAAWTIEPGDHLHEANLLALDATKAEHQLDWHNRLDLEKTVEWTVKWQRQVLAGADAKGLCESQIANFYDLE